MPHIFHCPRCDWKGTNPTPASKILPGGYSPVTLHYTGCPNCQGEVYPIGHLKPANPDPARPPAPTRSAWLFTCSVCPWTGPEPTTAPAPPDPTSPDSHLIYILCPVCGRTAYPPIEPDEPPLRQPITRAPWVEPRLTRLEEPPF